MRAWSICGLMLIAATAARAADDFILSGSGTPYFRHGGAHNQWHRFAPSGRQIISGSSHAVRLWDVAERRLIAEQRFEKEHQLIRGDERALVLFRKNESFVELDPTTLQPAADSPTPAMRFLDAIHQAHPYPVSFQSFKTQVSRFWSTPGVAMACKLYGRFCYAPEPDPKTWHKIECAEAAFSGMARTVVYSDRDFDRFRPDAPRHIVVERFEADGKRVPLFKRPHAKSIEPRGLWISADGSTIACHWQERRQFDVGEPDGKHAVEVFRADDGAPLGRIEWPAPHRLLELRFDAAGKKLALARLDQSIVYDIGPQGLVERSRRVLKLPDSAGYGFYASFDDELDRCALSSFGQGFAVVAAAGPAGEMVDADVAGAEVDNAFDWYPMGLLGDDTVVVQSALGFKCLALSDAARKVPEFRLPRSDMVAIADDRSCVLAVSEQGNATLYRRSDVPLRKQQFTTAKVEQLAVSGHGLRCAYSSDDIVHVFERTEGKGYTEIHSFDAGAPIEDLRLTADGRSLLTLLKGPKGMRVVVHHDDGRAWKIRCGPFDYDDIAGGAAFVGDELVVAWKHQAVERDQTSRIRFETRCINDDTVVGTSGRGSLRTFHRQLGRDGTATLLCDGELVFRNFITQQESVVDATFAENEWPLLAYRDLGLLVLRTPAGRLAVRRFETK